MISELRNLSWTIDRVKNSDDLDKYDVEECLGEILDILLKMNRAKRVYLSRHSHETAIVSEDETNEGD
jgi:hypothetical protein|tara:strand:- start:17808 stop:18011 length:204 start_codon:yes stop_codon:yes gene_type:complete